MYYIIRTVLIRIAFWECGIEQLRTQHRLFDEQIMPSSFILEHKRILSVNRCMHCHTVNDLIRTDSNKNNIASSIIVKRYCWERLQLSHFYDSSPNAVKSSVVFDLVDETEWVSISFYHDVNLRNNSNTYHSFLHFFSQNQVFVYATQTTGDQLDSSEPTFTFEVRPIRSEQNWIMPGLQQKRSEIKLRRIEWRDWQRFAGRANLWLDQSRSLWTNCRLYLRPRGYT
jgi:hypothetical protein